MNEPFWAAFPQVQTQIKQLEHHLLETTDLPNQPIHMKILKLLKSGGKFLRPGVYYLFANLGSDAEPQQLLAGASAQELLHLAVRFHDQVTDDTLHQVHLAKDTRQRNAIYAGDYLFTRYFSEILNTDPSAADMQLHVNAMQRILSGHLDQLSHRYDLDETIADYFADVNARTAEAFRFSAQQGAIMANAAPEIATLSGELGAAIGTAYQVRVDIELFLGATSSLLAALKSGTYPLPIIQSLANTDVQAILNKRDQITLADAHNLQTLITPDAAERQLGTLRQHIAEVLTQFPADPAVDDIAKFSAYLLA